MTAWMALNIIAVLAIAYYIYRYTHSLQRQFKVCSADLQTAIKQKKRSRAEYDIQHIYSIIGACITTKNMALAYQSVDVLKLAFGEEMARSQEATFLKNMVITAMQNKVYTAAEYLMDAYTPLVRTNFCKISIMQQIKLIGIVAFKQRQQFILTKSIDIIFNCFYKSTAQDEIKEGLAAIRMLGTLTIKRQDTALFREIIVQMIPLQRRYSMNDEMIGIVSVWLHGIIKRNNDELLAIITSLVNEVVTELNTQQLDFLLNEWKIIASTACLNPDISLGKKLLEQMVDIVAPLGDLRFWAQTSHCIGSIARVTLDTHGHTKALEVFYPLLDAGRKLLCYELKLMGSGCKDEERQQVLYTLTKETLTFTEYWARQKPEFSVGELLLIMQKWWLSLENSSQKSVSKYFQLIMLYWCRTRKRQARRGMPAEIDMSCLLTDKERTHLAFL